MTENLTLQERARERVDELGFTEAQKDFIFADWPEGIEHYSWLLTATRDEIVAWGEAGEWGRQVDENERI